MEPWTIYFVSYGDVVVSRLRDVGYCSLALRRQHQLVTDEDILGDDAVDVTPRDVTAHLVDMTDII